MIDLIDKKRWKRIEDESGIIFQALNKKLDIDNEIVLDMDGDKSTYKKSIIEAYNAFSDHIDDGGFYAFSLLRHNIPNNYCPWIRDRVTIINRNFGVLVKEMREVVLELEKENVELQKVKKEHEELKSYVDKTTYFYDTIFKWFNDNLDAQQLYHNELLDKLQKEAQRRAKNKDAVDTVSWLNKEIDLFQKEVKNSIDSLQERCKQKILHEYKISGTEVKQAIDAIEKKVVEQEDIVSGGEMNE